MTQLIADAKLQWFLIFAALLITTCLKFRLNYTLDGITNIHAREFSQERHQQLKFSFFPWPLLNCFPTENKQFDSLSIEHDLRLLPALWLHLIRENLEEQNFASLTVPFQWQSLLDLSPYNLPSKEFEPHIAETIHTLQGINGQRNRSDYANASLGPVEKPLSESERVALSINFLSHLYDFKPHKVVCLGLINDKLLDVKVEIDEKVHLKSVLETLVNFYQKSFPDADRISAYDEIRKTKEALKKIEATSNRSRYIHDDFSSSRSQYTIDELDFVYPYNVSDLLFTDKHNLNDERVSQFDHLDRSLLQNCLNGIHSPTKYFHEAHLLNDTAGFHFDWRFFKKAKFNDYEHKLILHRLARAWLGFCHSAKLTSWLAHGTLLGWYWNGLNFPWDEDIDVQMTAKSLYLLAKHFNQSIVIDYSNHDTDTMTYQYFIDVNPQFMNVASDDSANVIDARFIDMSSGMYVDITALTVTREEVLTNKQATFAMHSLINPTYSEAMISATSNPKYLKMIHDELNTQERKKILHQEIVNCKNNHFYLKSDIFPLITTSFEGAIANIPNNFKAILKNEYSNGLVHKHYMHWSFRPYLGIWLPDDVCKGEYYGRECKDKEAVLESSFTREFRHKRGEALLKLSRSRYDPFMIERNYRLFQIESLA